VAYSISHSYPDSLEDAVPFAKEAALAILLVGGKGFFLGVQPKNVGGADFDADIAARTCGSVDFNLRHESLLVSERQDVDVVSAEPERGERLPVKVRPTA
jgi:hypothetical protein